MDRQTLIIKAFFEFLAILLAKSMAIAKGLRRRIAAAEKANDFTGLQDLAVAWDKIQNKINKLQRAQAAFDSQANTIAAVKARGDMSFAQALEIIGGFSQPSKMPGLGYSLPAAACIIGQCLRRVANSVCARCYAHKGNYNYIEVLACLYRRLIAIQDLDLWYRAMVIGLRAYLAQVKKANKNRDLGYFRWHDSGDIQSIAHLAKIVDIARVFPTIRFWLPTKELAMVKAYLAQGHVIPDNLVIRISAPMVGQTKAMDLPLLASAVSSMDPSVYHCPAPSQDGHCGQCRACWSMSYPIVSYHAH